MKKLCTIIVFLFIAASLLVLPSLAAARELRFTAIPDQDSARLRERFDKVSDYLTETLGFQVTYIPVKSYAASVQAFKNNEVQMAWFGGLSGVQARLGVPGSRALAQGAEDERFVTYFIAHSSTGLKRSDSLPESVSGKTFTFGSKGSTSGRLMPEYYLRKQFDRSPGDLFTKVGFSGDHSKTIALVESGSYQVGAVNFKVWEKHVREGTVDTAKVSVIWQTPEYPDYNWSVRGDVDQLYGTGTTSRLQQALIDISEPALLEAFPRSRFIKADNSMYQPILETGKAIGIFR